MPIDPEQLLTRPEFSDRQRGLRTLCLGMMVVLTVVAIFVSLVVRFALGGRPLTGNAGLLGGVPIPTVIAAGLTLLAPVLAYFISRAVEKSGIASVADEPPPVPYPGADLETDAERLWRVFASMKFAEYALAEAAVLFIVVLYHITADWLMMLFIAGLIIYMATRYPSTRRIIAWFHHATAKLEELKAQRG